jgi:hypothetical protein
MPPQAVSTSSCKKLPTITGTDERSLSSFLGHRANRRFWEEYRKLPAEIRHRADKQFSLLKANPQHRSLQFKKVVERGGMELWSARVSLNYRALAIKEPRDYVWFWIGEHKIYDFLIH